MAGRPPKRRFPTALHFMRGVSLALTMVKAALENMPDDDLTPDQEALRRALCDDLNEWMPNENDLKPKPTNRELAGKCGISVRSVTNWRREGCQFEGGKWGVWRWLRNRRVIPAGAKVKFADLIERQKARE